VCKVLNVVIKGGLSIDIVHVNIESGIDLKYIKEELTMEKVASLDEESKNAIEGYLNILNIESELNIDLSFLINSIK